MKILHCLAQLPKMTGSGVYCTNVVNGMVKRGHKNAVVYGIQEPYTIDFDGETVHYPVEFGAGGLDFPIAGMSDEMPYKSTIYSQMTGEMYEKWMGAFRNTLLRAKEEFEPDLIISHHLFVLTSLVREIFPDSKIIGVCHSTDLRQARKNPWIIENYVHGLDKLDLCFAISPFDVDDIVEIYGLEIGKIAVMGGGYDEKVFYPGPKSQGEPYKLVFAGKLSHAKGVYELVQTLPIISQNYQVTLDLIGNADQEQVKEFKELSGYHPGLKIYNTEDQKGMADVMRTCDIYILPSYYEGLGLTAIEALACHVRAVATEIEGLRWLLGEDVNRSGIIEYIPFPRIYDMDKPFEEDIPEFIENLAQAVMTQIRRIENNEKVPKEIIESIDSHSWAKILDKMSKIFANLCLND